MEVPADFRRDDKIGQGAARCKLVDFSDGIDRIGKITIGLTDYGNQPSKYVRFNLDPGEALVLAHDVLDDALTTFGPIDQASGTDGNVQSRILKIDRDDKGRNVGYYIRLINGPGVRGDTGIVMPDRGRESEQMKAEIFLGRERASAGSWPQCRPGYSPMRSQRLREGQDTSPNKKERLMRGTHVGTLSGRDRPRRSIAPCRLDRGRMSSTQSGLRPLSACTDTRRRDREGEITPI